VYHFTINTLDTLPLHMPGATQSRDLLRVLSLLPPPGARSIKPVTSLNVPHLARPCGATWLGSAATLMRLKAMSMPSWLG
jgi:hypothetical protein